MRSRPKTNSIGQTIRSYSAIFAEKNALGKPRPIRTSSDALGKPRPIRSSDVVYGIYRGLPSEKNALRSTNRPSCNEWEKNVHC